MPFTIPWKGYEGLFFLEIKVSEMGVQDLIFGVVNMLHMLLSSALTLQNMLPLLRWRRMSMLHKKTRKCTKKGHLGLQLDMRYNVALLQSVAAALPKALWH